MGDCERIFCVDDHPGVRKALVGAITDAGHIVVAESASPQEAEAVIDNHQIEFRVAIVDANCPKEGDGAAICKSLRSKRPNTVIISLSTEPQTFGDHNLGKLGRDSITELFRTLKNI